MALSKIIRISIHQRWVLQQHFCCLQASAILARERIQIQTMAYPALCLDATVHHASFFYKAVLQI